MSFLPNINVGGLIGDVLSHDFTPGFNITKNVGTGIPFIANGNSSTSPDPVYRPAATQQTAVTNSRPTGNQDTGSNSTTYSGGGGSGPTAQDLAQYGYYTSIANDVLGRLDNSFGTRQGNINQQYGQTRNEYNSAKQSADQTLGQQLQTAKGQFVTHQNQINENARQVQQSLLRQLGILGAGGGSAALFAIPNAVNIQTNQALSGAGQDYAQNAQTANTAYNNYINTQYEPGLQKLEGWKQDQLNQAQADYNQNHEGLLRVLQGLQNHSANADTLGSQVLGYQANIPNLIRPAGNYTGEIAQYQAPTLNSYEQQVLPQAQVQSANQGSSPRSYLSILAGQQKKQQANQLV